MGDARENDFNLAIPINVRLSVFQLQAKSGAVLGFSLDGGIQSKVGRLLAHRNGKPIIEGKRNGVTDFNGDIGIEECGSSDRNNDRCDIVIDRGC